YLRGTILTGFPWNTIGYAAMINPLMMQSSAVLGLYGVTFFALIIFASPLVSLTSTTKDLDGKRPKGVLYFALFLSVLHIGYGAYRLSANPTKFNDEASLRIVQPNINQADKFEEENSSKILATYLSLSSKPGIEDTTHVFWPESAFPFFLTERPDALSAIAAMLPDNAQLITGAVRAEAGKSGDPYGFVYNTTYSINSEGAIEAAADKVHLVPFGEYLPFQNILEAFGLRQITRLRGGFEAGAQRTLISGGKAGMLLPLICYEIIFPQEAYAFKGNDKKRPSAVINVTNDAWYGNSPGPFQHSRQSIIRSVEMGLPLIRVANSGISSVSDAFGRVQAKLDLNEKGFFDTKMPLAANRTLFIEYGMLPFFISLLAFFALCLGKNIILKD
ncbi:MAG: apolipoprotein N-acyltransferase, partial [Nitratireductor sp.]